MSDAAVSMRRGLTERELEEAHLRQIAAIVESSDDAIIGTTLDGTITSWNPAAVRIYGYSASEAIGRSIEMLVPEALRGDVPGILAQVQAGDWVEQYETGRARKDGKVIDVWLTISGVKDASGAVVGASTIARDIKERVRGVEALHRSEDSYRALFERHPAPMWVYDLATLRFLRVNEAAIASYGYSREEFLSMTIQKILAPEDETALSEGREASVLRHRRKNGTFVEVLVSSDAIEFEGREAGLVLAQDLTAQRGLEEQLRQGQKMEAIGRLAGGIAHDFNNLLLVIRGYSAILLNELSDEDQRDSAQQIDSAAERAGEFTRQLLAFSRQQVLRPEITDLNAVVAETLTLLQRSIGGNVQIESELEPGIGTVLVDRGQIAQAVMNLALNARDAMSEGGGVLSICTAAVELDEDSLHGHDDVTPGSYVLLKITDSGTGMDKETQSRVFDPFFTTKDQGTGLGLATVYGLVKQSGGHIWFYSEPGMGTTFELYFPTTDVNVIPRTISRDLPSLRGNETILLVDDTDVVRSLVTNTLESYGYTVLAAASGRDALRIAEQTDARIDLVMTDVVMPRMNGRELADRLIATCRGLKVLFTSGYPSDTVLRHGIEGARTAFIEKPYLPNDLARKVRETLDA